MIVIHCPWCGPRNMSEFTYGGDATAKRPADPASASDGEWFDYIYLRDNPRGAHLELWHHNAGCRRWVKVLRDTLTHEIIATGAPEASLEPGRK
jgi:heterotetrameric sarcosine oxidase delta subunit